MYISHILLLGMVQAWASILDANLEPFGITTLQSAWLGCWMTMSGCAASIIGESPFPCSHPASSFLFLFTSISILQELFD